MVKKLLPILSLSLLATGSAWASDNTLTVYTYSSFASDWGPGPAIKKAFEAQCDCNLEF
ncbi:thiamine ABC transporter substrate-binding protein, partial [Pseudomonadota bacterium]